MSMTPYSIFVLLSILLILCWMHGTIFDLPLNIHQTISCCLIVFITNMFRIPRQENCYSFNQINYIFWGMTPSYIGMRSQFSLSSFQYLLVCHCLIWGWHWCTPTQREPKRSQEIDPWTLKRSSLPTHHWKIGRMRTQFIGFMDFWQQNQNLDVLKTSQPHQ